MNPIRQWRHADERQRLLQYVQPGLIGLIDGTISTLAPMFAAAYVAGSHAALMVGLAATAIVSSALLVGAALAARAERPADRGIGPAAP